MRMPVDSARRIQSKRNASAFSLAYVNHHSRFEVQDDGQMPITTANGNLVDGDLPQVSELRFAEAPLQIVLDDFLDHIPTDAQVQGDIPNGHHPRQFQDLLGKAAGVAASGIGKLDGCLSKSVAVAALYAGDAKNNSRLPAADRQAAEPSHHPALEGSVLSATCWATTPLRVLHDREHDSALNVLRANTPVATDAKSVVQQTPGHADSSHAKGRLHNPLWDKHVHTYSIPRYASAG
jgi:hypothetical protein